LDNGLDRAKKNQDYINATRGTPALTGKDRARN